MFLWNRLLLRCLSGRHFCQVVTYHCLQQCSHYHWYLDHQDIQHSHPRLMSNWTRQTCMEALHVFAFTNHKTVVKSGQICNKYKIAVLKLVASPTMSFCDYVKTGSDPRLLNSCEYRNIVSGTWAPSFGATAPCLSQIGKIVSWTFLSHPDLERFGLSDVVGVN